MKIFITGGTGFVGTYLSRMFIQKGWQVQATGTSPIHPLTGHAGFDYIPADTTQPGEWQQSVKKADVIVNLAGRNIFNYWTDQYKKQIHDSRILTTKHLVDALEPDANPLFLSTSAAGYYGDRGDDVLTEFEPPGMDFLAKVCVAWEAEALKAAAKNVRVVLMRFGVILGQRGGALEKMLPAFKFFAGGPLGSGAHWFPWIHITDLYAAILFLMESPDATGPYNLCSPISVQYKQFSSTLGSVLHRPARLKTPAFVLKLIMGEMGKSMLNSQRAVPDKLTQSGFIFQYPELKSALQSLT